jgi:hypothetical protein
MKKLFLILAFFSVSAFAQDSDVWLHIGETKNFNFYAKKGSMELTKNGAKLIQSTYKKDGSNPKFYIIEMKSIDCKNGFGYVYQNHFDGKLNDRFDYVEDGGTVAQQFGDILCDFLKRQPSV